MWRSIQNLQLAAVRLQFYPTEIVLEVEDHGAGFSHKHNQGMGMISMKERVELVNGRIQFLSGTQGGALVRVSAPLTLEESHDGE